MPSTEELTAKEIYAHGNWPQYAELSSEQTEQLKQLRMRLIEAIQNETDAAVIPQGTHPSTEQTVQRAMTDFLKDTQSAPAIDKEIQAAFTAVANAFKSTPFTDRLNAERDHPESRSL